MTSHRVVRFRFALGGIKTRRALVLDIHQRSHCKRVLSQCCLNCPLSCPCLLLLLALCLLRSHNARHAPVQTSQGTHSSLGVAEHLVSPGFAVSLQMQRVSPVPKLLASTTTPGACFQVLMPFARPQLRWLHASGSEPFLTPSITQTNFIR